MPLLNELRLVLVTPETTLLDEPVKALRLPLYDGQVGLLPGRMPMVGRLGYGELKLTQAGGERSYYVDGGFVQVKGAVVSVLTNRAVPADELDPGEANELLQEATARIPSTEIDFAAKARDLERARRMLSLSRRQR